MDDSLVSAPRRSVAELLLTSGDAAVIGIDRCYQRGLGSYRAFVIYSYLPGILSEHPMCAAAMPPGTGLNRISCSGYPIFLRKRYMNCC